MKSFTVSIASLLLMLAACGGGGGGDSADSTSAPLSVTGVAAVGAPIASQPVTVKDSTGVLAKATTTAADGTFSVDVSGLKAPFMLRVQQADGTFLYSAAVGNGIANINPLSNLILGRLATAASVGTDPNALYQGFATFASRVTTSRLDSATASVYGDLSLAFKARLGSTGSDFSPIYAPYTIGNAMDRTFDALAIYYDPQSGDFQEKDTSQIRFKAFGPLAPLTNISQIAGRYGDANPGLVVIDNAGHLLVRIDEHRVAYGILGAPGATSATGTAVVYTLDDNGNRTATWTPANVTARLSLNKLSLQLVLFSGEILNLNFLSPDVNGTYGNNLKAQAKTFRFATLGPFRVGNGDGTEFGSSQQTGRMYLDNATNTSTDDANCIASNSWSFGLSDLELSLYSVTLTETVSSLSSSRTACPLAGNNYDTVGTAVFVNSGLLVFFQDRASAATGATYGATAAAPGFVSVKLFKPI